jgi:hypothetical protein
LFSRPHGAFSWGIHSGTHWALEDLIEELGIHHGAINPIYKINDNRPHELAIPMSLVIS